jgi:hypothetical protein
MRIYKFCLIIVFCSLSFSSAFGVSCWPHPTPEPAMPGAKSAFHLNSASSDADQPMIFSWTHEAGPDESFLLAGSHLGKNVTVWGHDPLHPEGVSFIPHIQQQGDDVIIATIPQHESDGLYFVSAGSPTELNTVRLNAPEPWWIGPDKVRPGDIAEVFGRCLSRRPDNAVSFLYLCQSGHTGFWLKTIHVNQYSVSFRVPTGLAAGDYQLWVYAGMGGEYGWGGPVRLYVEPAVRVSHVINVHLPIQPEALQSMLDHARPGDTIRLSAGTVHLINALKIPADVTLQGAGAKLTSLQLSSKTAGILSRPQTGWNAPVSELQNSGERLYYRFRTPAGGRWNVWLRYTADDAGFDMSGRSQIIIDGGKPVSLSPIPNTASWDTFSWSQCASIGLTAGVHTMEWRNVKGGGLNIDAWVLSRDSSWKPGMLSSIKANPEMVVVHGADVTKMQTLEGALPVKPAPMVWLSGDNCGLKDLSVFGNDRAANGIEIVSARPLAWISGVKVENVRVADLDGKYAENIAVLLRRAQYARVAHCMLTARSPIFFSGARQCQVEDNRCTAVTRFDGNAEAALQSRTEPLEQCIIRNNVIVGPEYAGGPTARRLIWFSTGHGSVDNNYIAGNKCEHCRFGGVAGTDQNVGETILFETNMRVAFYGHPASAGLNDVTLPSAAYLPPEIDDGSVEPPVSQYYLTVIKGKGMGQTRRVVGRKGYKILLDNNWRIMPDSFSLVLMEPMFVRNLVVRNTVIDGMTGVQLWIGGVENIIADNTIENERREGIYLYGGASTLDATMENHWNAGIGPLFFNTVEGNTISSTAQAISVGLDDHLAAQQSAGWPLALGTVFRFNTGINSRYQGFSIMTGAAITGEKPYVSALGTIVEFNMMRDQPVGYLSGNRTEVTLFRRDFAYFWNLQPGAKPVGFDTAGAVNPISELNNIEDGQGNEIPDHNP